MDIENEAYPKIHKSTSKWKCGLERIEAIQNHRLTRFRPGSAAYELWKAGSTVEECMELTGHRTEAMFKRYADLFSGEERRSIQRQAQKRRHEWRQAERDRASQAPDPSGVGEGVAQERNSGRVQ